MISSHFYATLSRKPVTGFTELIVLSVATVAAVVALQSLATYLCGCLCVVWRELLTTRLHRLYFHDFSLYEVNQLPLNYIDNPYGFIDTHTHTYTHTHTHTHTHTQNTHKYIDSNYCIVMYLDSS